ncbi:MAG: lipocalin-like domain-containing protein [Desulfomonilaceae bacterium]
MISILVFLLCAVVSCPPVLLASDVLGTGAGSRRVLSFPKDHGKHPEFQTEWWYFTGNLDSDKDHKWGFQLTFFRRTFVRTPARKLSAWAVRDLFPAHFALTDESNRNFFHTELLTRKGPGLAHAASDDLDVSVKDWYAKRLKDEIFITAREQNYALDLRLVPEKPIVLEGDAGYSQKGDSKDQASYYYSFTRLKANGTLTFKGTSHKVAGLAWMDHEFGSSMLRGDQSGWDWFALQLNDGTEVMVFHLRKKDNTFERPFGTFVPKKGPAVDLAGEQITILPTRTWTSPVTKAVYPSGWTVEIPDRNITLKVKPVIEAQELTSESSIGIIYWEGAVTVTGFRDGKKVEGRGYVELTGYAHSMKGRL